MSFKKVVIFCAFVALGYYIYVQYNQKNYGYFFGDCHLKRDDTNTKEDVASNRAKYINITGINKPVTFTNVKIKSLRCKGLRVTTFTEENLKGTSRVIQSKSEVLEDCLADPIKSIIIEPY